MIESFTNFGLPSSSISYISSRNDNSELFSRSIGIVKKLFLYSGIFGAVIVFCFAYFLGNLTFGSPEYSWVFSFTCVTLFFNQQFSGNNVIFQALYLNKSIARVSIIASITSLIITLPLYYFLKKNAIVPSIIISSILLYSFSIWEFRKNNIKYYNVDRLTLQSEGKKILTLGLAISLANVLTLFTSYILRVYINKIDGFDAVGLYTSGFAILNTYVGLVFSAMALDYFPRLSAVSNDLERIKGMVNEQAEIAILLLTPILIIFTVFIKYIIVILYSISFLPILPMLFWSTIGIHLKSITWSMGYVILAKSNSKLFFINELLSNVLFFILSYLGYFYMKFEGLGIAFVISNLFNVFQVYSIVHFKYKFTFSSNYIRIFIFQFILLVLTLFVSRLFAGNYFFIFSLILLSFSSAYSIKIIRSNTSARSILNIIKKKGD